MFYICWQSKITGETGRGAGVYDKATAQAIVDAANAKYPMLYHWLEEAK